jgi:hypothetical protein
MQPGSGSFKLADRSVCSAATIAYVATDQNGLSATTTRTVVVVAPDSAESPTGSTPTVQRQGVFIVSNNAAWNIELYEPPTSRQR